MATNQLAKLRIRNMRQAKSVRQGRERQNERQSEAESETVRRTNRQRQSKAERQRQIDRQSDRHTDRQTDRQTDRDRIKSEAETVGQTEGQDIRQSGEGDWQDSPGGRIDKKRNWSENLKTARPVHWSSEQVLDFRK